MTPPSANIFLRWPWQKRERLIEKWHHDVWALCNFSRIYPCEKLHLDCTIYFKDKRKRDPANFVTPLDKLVFDGLTRCGIIADDSPEHLTWSVPILNTDRDNPRTEILISSNHHQSDDPAKLLEL